MLTLANHQLFKKIFPLPLTGMISYTLGTLLSALNPKTSWLNDCLANIHLLLTGWKGRHHTIAGRLLQIKSVLSSKLAFLSCIGPVPCSISHQIETSSTTFSGGVLLLST